MKELRSLLKDWIGDDSVSAKARQLGVGVTTLWSWLNEGKLPSTMAITGPRGEFMAAQMGIPAAELEAVVMIPRRAEAAGLQLALVVSLGDHDEWAVVRLLDDAEREFVVTTLAAHGGPMGARVGDVIAHDGARAIWIAVDERPVIEAQRIRLAALAAKPETVPPKSGDDKTPINPNPTVGG